MTPDKNILQFNGQWRNYQKRVLDNTKQYLADGKVHIVAAPGSGKTTLGIEMIKRQGRPCLVLVPSIVIREQWLQRIREAFLPDGNDGNDYLSNDIRKPAFITVITYQALHAALSKYTRDQIESEETDYSDFSLFRTLRANGIGTLCLDECHHLRSEWWKALETLQKEIPGMIKISLTATPPYDSTQAQWQRYTSLCGEIDEEIATPELVREGSLCPHQDYIMFNYPTRAEERAFRAFKSRAKALVDWMMEDEEFAAIISSHKGLADVEGYAERFLDHPPYLSALLIFLRQKNIPFSKYLTKLLGTNKLPKMDVKWAQHLLQGFLYTDKEAYSCKATYHEHLIREMRGQELIVKNKVMLAENDNMEKMLINSKGKIKSIETIVSHELEHMGSDLRLLILTDYIKKEYIKAVGDTAQATDAIGVIPIFEVLRRKDFAGQKLGVLCGSIVVIPAEAEPVLTALMKERTGKDMELKFKRFPVASTSGATYSWMETKSSDKALTMGMTALFEKGYVNVLIGTKSLLGEGWDSPAVNSLIMASFIGAFMLSNQMRGRAIRTMKENPHKTSNIWHLICVGKGGNETQDYITLKKRMDHFLGVHYTENTIESGIERLSVIEKPLLATDVDKINQKMLERSARRSELANRWHSCLELYDENGVQVECEMEKERFKVSAQFINFFAVFMVSIILDVISFSMNVRFAQDGSLIVALVCVCVAGGFTILTLLFGVKVINLLTPWRLVRKVGKAMLKGMVEQGYITTPQVRVEVTDDGYMQSVYLKGGSMREKDLFARAVEEFYKPVDNPRYLLIKGRKGSFWSCYNVPEIFTKRKEDALVFEKHIKKAIRRHRVVYTRNPEGRKLLLTVRVKAFANQEERLVFKKKKMRSKLV